MESPSKAPTPPGGDLPGENKITGEFLSIAKIGTALGFGFMIASIQALGHEGRDGFTFNITVWTLLAFLGGVAVAFLFWKFALASFNEGKSFKKPGFLLAVVGFFAFIYPIKFVPREKFAETLTGLLLAFGVLSLVGFVFWKVKSFLDRDYDTANK